MVLAERTDLFDLSATKADTIASALVWANAFRLDASAFLNADNRASVSAGAHSGKVLAEIADVFTVYIQTPILHHVAPFAHSRPYLTTSELGEYQRGEPTHVSLLTDPRLIEWQITRNTIVLSRSGRVGEAYWVDKKLADALVGDSFRVVPRRIEDTYFLYALLASSYARDYVSGVTYGSVVDHASVEQVRSLPVPTIADRHRARISDLVRQAVLARDAAYDLLDAAEEALLRTSALGELRYQTPAAFDPLGQPEWFAVRAKRAQETNNEGSEYRLDAHFYNPTAEFAVAHIRKCRSEIKTVGDVAKVLFTGGRFKRNYVEREHGVPFLSGKNVVQIRPTDLKFLAKVQEDEIRALGLNKGWTLVTRSGTIGRTCFVWRNYETYLASEDLLRVIPDESRIDAGFLYGFLATPYGYEQILRCRHGSVIDHVTDKHIAQVLVPCPSRKDQEEIGDKVREAYEKRAEAVRLEDEAQSILMNELTRGSRK